MRHDDDAHKGDQTAVGRGVVYGFIFGAVMWGLIIAVAVYLLR